MRIVLLILLTTLTLFADIAKVTAMKGKATLVRGNETIEVVVGLKLKEKDVINTQDKTRVQFIFKDKTIVTIGKNALFSIYEYLHDTNEPKNSKVNLGFIKGTFKAITGQIGKMNPNKFKLKTKTATIGIRGTTVLGNQNQVACLKGEIAVSSHGVTRVVPEGMMTSTPLDAPPTPPAPYKAGTMELDEKSQKESEKEKSEEDKEKEEDEKSEEDKEKEDEKEKSEDEKEESEKEEGDKDEAKEESEEETKETKEEDSKEESQEESKESDKKEETKEESTETEEKEATEEKSQEDTAEDDGGGQNKEESASQEEQTKEETTEDETQEQQGSVTEEEQDETPKQESTKQEEQGDTSQPTQNEQETAAEQENVQADTQDAPNNEEVDDQQAVLEGQQQEEQLNEPMQEQTEPQDEPIVQTEPVGAEEASVQTEVETTPLEDQGIEPDVADVPAVESDAVDTSVVGDMGSVEIGDTIPDDMGSMDISEDMGSIDTDFADIIDVATISDTVADTVEDVEDVVEDVEDIVEDVTEIVDDTINQDNTEDLESDITDDDQTSGDSGGDPDPGTTTIDPTTTTPASGDTNLDLDTADTTAEKETVDSIPYMEFGYWTTDINSETARYDTFITGDLTPSVVIENMTGIASYSGTIAAMEGTQSISGTIGLSIDFSNQKLSGDMNLGSGKYKALMNEGGSVNAYGFSTTNFSDNGGTNTVTSGSLNGKFYGPSANAVGGDFTLNGGGVKGVFGAQQ